MDYRLFGRTGVRVSPLCLGALNFGGATVSHFRLIKTCYSCLFH